jgi:CBS domain-containing protein
VARLMLEHRISGVPVVDRGGQIVGIITDGDLYRRAEAGSEKQRGTWIDLFTRDSRLAHEFVAAHGHTAADIMTTRIFAVTPEMPLRQIADLFEKQRIRRVPVVSDGALVGIISRANLVQAFISTTKEDARLTLSDQRIRDLVIADYKRLSWGMPSEGNVIVTDGIVHLWGYVPSAVELDVLRIAAQGVPGVKGFEDHTFRYFGEAEGVDRPKSSIVISGPDSPVSGLPA